MSKKSSIDTSSISFTALYTGHAWATNGLSYPPFRTTAGRLYYHALTPVEWAGRLLLGANIRTLLLQRHQMIDSLLEQAIEERGCTQVLEIACGLSPRGCRFMKSRPDLDYVEADLPEMARRKQKLLRGLDGPVPEVVPINILAEDGELSVGEVFRRFDRSEPIAVITEGLTVYFDRETIDGFWRRLASELSGFAASTYLSDTYFKFGRGPTRWIVESARSGLAAIARSRVSFHFQDAEEIQSYFEGLSFDEVHVHDPRDHYDTLSIPRARRDPIVRVVECRAHR